MLFLFLCVHTTPQAIGLPLRQAIATRIAEWKLDRAKMGRCSAPPGRILDVISGPNHQHHNVRRRNLAVRMLVCLCAGGVLYL